MLSKEQLLAKVWGVESTAVDNNVEAYISFLRKKFRFVGSRVTIESLRKTGYRLNLGEDSGGSDAAGADTTAR